MLGFESPRGAVACARCGTPCVEVQDAIGRHAWWQCIVCHGPPYIPLDWRVRWPATSATPIRGENRT